MPSSVISFSVTKLRPGLQTMTLASVIFMMGPLGGFPNPPAMGFGGGPAYAPRVSLVHTAAREAAVDHDHLAVDEAGRLRREKDRRARALIGVSEALHRLAP